MEASYCNWKLASRAHTHTGMWCSRNVHQSDADITVKLLRLVVQSTDEGKESYYWSINTHIHQFPSQLSNSRLQSCWNPSQLSELRCCQSITELQGTQKGSRMMADSNPGPSCCITVSLQNTQCPCVTTTKFLPSTVLPLFNQHMVSLTKSITELSYACIKLSSTTTACSLFSTEKLYRR